MPHFIEAKGAPTENTHGNVNDVYIDTETGSWYKCVDTVVAPRDHGFIDVYSRGAHNTTYVWETLGGRSSGDNGSSSGGGGEWLFKDVVCNDAGLAEVTAVPTPGAYYILYQDSKPVCMSHWSGDILAFSNGVSTILTYSNGQWKCTTTTHSVFAPPTISICEYVY